MPKQIDWAAIRKEFIESPKNLTYVDLAKRFGVSVSAIEGKAGRSGENWQRLRDAFRLNQTLSIHTENPSTTTQLDIDQLDPGAIVDTAILRLYAQLGDLQARSLERSVDSLVRLIELRRKLKPPTPAEWAEVGIAEFGLDPVQLWAEVKNQWQQNL